MTELQEKYRRSIGRWRCATITLFLLCLALLITLIAVGVLKDRRFEQQAAPDCAEDQPKPDIDTSEAEVPGLFDDLTYKELEAVQEFMYKNKKLNLVRPSQAAVNTSYIYVSDLHPPLKSEALKYLDKSGPKPERNARIVVFRGDSVPPVSEEYVVGPLPNPSRCNLLASSARKNPVPYSYRPVGYVEFGSYYQKLFPEVDRIIGHVLRESFGGTFTNCGHKCLTFYPTPVGSAISGQDVRKIWMTISHYREYYSLTPVDMLMLANLHSANPDEYFIEKIVYGGYEYNGPDDLARKYNTTNIYKPKIPFPADDQSQFSSMYRRGEPVPKEPKRPPRMYEPDGKRYSLHHRKAEYMQWKFNFRMSTLSGPQLYDIRFNDERIAYELGLQEIAVYYASNNSATRSADFVDSGALIGTHSQSLVPGADCPITSTFIDLPYLEEKSEKPLTLQKAFCLFELNTGVPLRRHLSYSTGEGGFYSGLEDNVLILRSIMTIINYDYIMDYIFHQSGALEVRVMSTGYIFTSFYSPKEDPYGFRLHKNILGNIHHHMFFFKADIDIQGTSNRYETLDISSESAPNEQTVGRRGALYHQIRMDRRLKNTEMDAVYHYNFDHPKYHVIHNNNSRTKYGAMKAYRIHLNGMSKQLLPPDIGNERSITWARNQMVVTKYKDDERDSSSLYGLFDTRNPTVNFTEFFVDDEDIVDQDLVTWITMGTHHIPHTEDLPVTPTAASHLGFALLPYNYFAECPSSQSRDSIRVEYKDKYHPEKGARVERYGYPSDKRCIPQAVDDYDRQVAKNPSSAIESSYHEVEEVVSPNGEHVVSHDSHDEEEHH